MAAAGRFMLGGAAVCSPQGGGFADMFIMAITYTKGFGDAVCMLIDHLTTLS